MHILVSSGAFALVSSDYESYCSWVKASLVFIILVLPPEGII